MSSLWPFTLFALVTWPWWWPVWRTLRADLERASSPTPSPTLPRPEALLGPTPSAESRVPLNRLLAFQGVRRRAAARRRWEAGFGRRGL